MVYIALLRGINVGGHSIVGMADLQACFEAQGFEQVKTYINSGNVVFVAPKQPVAALASQLEQAIEKSVGAPIKVLVKTLGDIEQLCKSIPSSWVNDATTKCDVVFLWPAIDTPSIIDQIPHKPEIETVQYYPGVVTRCIAKQNATKSPFTKIIGTELYAQMTIRNINTVRKVLGLMQERV